MIQDYARLAYLSLKSRRLRSWLTMIGVFIGIAAVVSLVSLGEGLRGAISGQFNLLSTDVLSVNAQGTGNGPPGEGVAFPLKEYYVDDIEHVRGVESAIGRSIELTKVTFDGHADFTYAASMPDGEKRKELHRIVSLEAMSGRLLRDGDAFSVVLGSNFASGDRFGKPVRLRDTVGVNGKEFEVVGFLEKRGSFIIDNAVLMNEEIMNSLFNLSDEYDVIAITVEPPSLMDAVKKDVEDYLRKERDVEEGEEDFTVESSEKQLDQLNSILFAVQLFVYVIAGVSLFIGGLGIANTMYTAVLERTREIGIMKSVGASNHAIFTLFFLEAGLLGMVGGFIGAALGVGIAYGVSSAGGAALGTDLLRVTVSPLLLFGAITFSFLIGVVSGLLPALRAAHLKPVDALRYSA